MAIYKIILETVTPVQMGGLTVDVQSKREFHLEGGGDYLDTMFRVAKEHGWHCTAIPVYTRSIESIVEAFARTVVLDIEV